MQAKFCERHICSNRWSWRSFMLRTLGGILRLRAPHVASILFVWLPSASTNQRSWFTAT
jgi:hypothetical protein